MPSLFCLQNDTLNNVQTEHIFHYDWQWQIKFLDKFTCGVVKKIQKTIYTLRILSLHVNTSINSFLKSQRKINHLHNIRKHQISPRKFSSWLQTKQIYSQCILAQNQWEEQKSVLPLWVSADLGHLNVGLVIDTTMSPCDQHLVGIGMDVNLVSTERTFSLLLFYNTSFKKMTSLFQKYQKVLSSSTAKPLLQL